MKVLFLSSWFPSPPDNGSKIRVYHLMRALGQRHQVTLLSFAFGTARPDGVDPNTVGCREIHVVQQSPFDRGRLARAARYFSPNPIVDAPVAEMSRLVSRIVRQSPPELVVASTTSMAAYANRIQVPRVLEEHNSWSRSALERYDRETRPVGRLRRWASWQKRSRYESRLYRRFDLCTMVSEADREAAERLLGGRTRVAVVPNGVDCDANRPGLAEVVPGTLVFNGALTYGANFDAMRFFLAQVYPLIQAEMPAVSLTITGPLDEVDCGALRLDDTVHLSGYVGDVRPLVAGSWACVVPIRAGGGTRLKILEAMALGTPVISTSKGAEGLEVTPGRDLLIADSPADFAGQVIRLLRDRPLREQLAGSARRLVSERYDWEQIGQRFVGLVEEVAGDGPRV